MILAVATTFFNFIVILVICTNKKKNKDQRSVGVVYRLSLALSDFLVGLFVFPSIIITLLKVYQGRLRLGEVTLRRHFTVFTTNLFLVPPENVTCPSAFTSLKQSFVDGFGYFTIFSLVVSDYTLVAASIDRFIAVYRPYFYRAPRRISFAHLAVEVVWIAAAFFSALPFFITDFHFELSIGGVVISWANSSLTYVIYSIVILLAVIVMWIATIATIIVFKVKTKWKKRKNAHHSLKNNVFTRLEKRAIFTLTIMVGVFTLCLLPIGASLAMPYLVLADPGKEFVHFIKWSSSNAVFLIALSTNSLWNFFIYNAREKSFRKKSKTLILKLLCVKTNCNECDD